MLPPFIIEQIRQREKLERARHEQQPFLEVPLDMPEQHAPHVPEDETGNRGVVIIDLGRGS